MATETKSFGRLLSMTKFGAKAGLSLGFGMTGAEFVTLFVQASWKPFVYAVTAAAMVMIYWRFWHWVFARFGSR